MLTTILQHNAEAIARDGRFPSDTTKSLPKDWNKVRPEFAAIKRAWPRALEEARMSGRARKNGAGVAAKILAEEYGVAHTTIVEWAKRGWLD